MSALKILLGFAFVGGVAAAVMAGGKDEEPDEKPKSGGDEPPSRIYTYRGYTVTIGPTRRMAVAAYRWRVYKTPEYQQGVRNVQKSATAESMAAAEDAANAWVDSRSDAPDMATMQPTEPLGPKEPVTMGLAGMGLLFAGVDTGRDVAMDMTRVPTGYRWRIYPENILPPLEPGEDDVDRVKKVDDVTIESALLASGTAPTEPQAREDAEDALENLKETPAGTVSHGVLMSPDCKRLLVLDSLRWISWASVHLQRMGDIEDQDPLDLGRHLLTGAFPDCEFPQDLEGMGVVTPGGLRDLYDLLAKVDDSVIQPLRADPMWAGVPGLGMGTPHEAAAAIFVSQALPDKEPPGFVHRGWHVELTELPGSFFQWEAWRLGKRNTPPQRKGKAMGPKLAVKRAIKAIEAAEDE